MTHFRPDGRLRRPWGGAGLNGYAIEQQQLAVANGGQITWTESSFAADQEAYITLQRAKSRSAYQALLLKIQGSDWRRGAVAVYYSADSHGIGVTTYIPHRGWRILQIFPVTMHAGDQLGARALTDGSVEVYRNGALAGIANQWP